jgi:hypothetical protein
MLYVGGAARWLSDSSLLLSSLAVCSNSKFITAKLPTNPKPIPKPRTLKTKQQNLDDPSAGYAYMRFIYFCHTFGVAVVIALFAYIPIWIY